MPKYIVETTVDEDTVRNLFIHHLPDDVSFSITESKSPEEMTIEEKLKALPPTDCKMVFAISKSDYEEDKYLYIGSENDWDIQNSKGCLSDGYSDEEHDLVHDTLNALGIKAYEAMESTYELSEPTNWNEMNDPEDPVNGYHDYVRNLLGQAPGFTYDPNFEKWLDNEIG